MSKITIIDFHGNSLPTFEQDGQVYVVMRPIVEALGLNWSAQTRRIERHEVLSVVAIMATTELKSEDGKSYEMLALPIDYMNGWLFGISTKKVAEQYRAAILDYQRDCFRVLYQHYNGNQVAPMIQSHKYWDSKRPAWAAIKALAMQGLNNIQVAAAYPYPDGRVRRAQSVGNALARQYEVGYTNPMHVFMARMKPETAERWAITKPIAVMWGKPQTEQTMQTEMFAMEGGAA